jgi:hypothetical protein
MRADHHQPFNDDSRVIKFRPRAGVWHRLQRWKTAANDPGMDDSPVADLTKYELPESNEDYRHRMCVNAAAAVVTTILILAGVWIANMMAHT